VTYAPGNQLLPASQRASFAEQFEKDLQFFQLLFLLINKSCPIRNIDLMWRDAGHAHRSEQHHVVGTAQALEDAFSTYVGCERTDPNPRFCSIVTEEGRRYAESCGRCDRAAMERVGQTGKSEVYRCHAGLIDIAVPVICDGRHIATLFSGQVLREPPSPSGWVQIRDNVRSLAYVDGGALEKAYWQVPVVSADDVERTVRIMELFAAYLATCWQRLREAVDTQQGRIRASQLQKKEFAHLLLEGDGADRARLRELARSLGFTRYPNRVLLVRPEDEEQYASSEVSFELAFTQVLHAIEDVAERSEDVTSAHLRRRGICVFFRDGGDRQAGGDLHARMLAQRILTAVGARSDIRLRVGIGRVKNEWLRLRESYHEAWAALAESGGSIAVRGAATPAVRELSTQAEHACRLLSERRLREARVALLSLPMLASRNLGGNGTALKLSRQYLCSALEPMLQAASKLGCDAATVAAWRADGLEAIELAPTMFELHEAWATVSEKIVGALGRLYAGRHEKLVQRVQRLIERRMECDDEPAAASLCELAAAAGVSPGHLSRTFKRVSGSTFERYLMVKRVERARRMLLDPAARVSEVAERCGFCNPAYFARVFRRIAGCSPSEFSKYPNGVLDAQEAGNLPASTQAG
jgi:AraC-like DNA-binding protein/ligand-binding sensor protein